MQTHGWSLDEWLAQLETYSAQEIVLGLERVEVLLQRMDLHMPRIVFHVAGTNGKGSSAAMLESLLLHTGSRVGCYTSPHLQRYNERIRIDGAEASDAQIISAFASIDALRADVPLTYFEFGTLAALHVFAQADVEIAVFEVGMGGRLDAVNAIEPTASLITNVSLDHCNWLGDSIEAIAAEKAGIMRAAKPVVFAAAEMPQAIMANANSTGAKLVAASRDYDWTVDGDSWSWHGASHSLRKLAKPSLQGEMQIQNAAGVLALLETAGFESLLNMATINVALGDLQLGGRMQAVGKQWILDVAHNPAAAKVLARALNTEVRGASIVIIGMLDDKDVAGFVAPLTGIADKWIAVTAINPRAIPANELARRVANATDSACLIADSLDLAIENAAQMATAEDRVLVTGSFYVVGAAFVILAAPEQHDG